MLPAITASLIYLFLSMFINSLRRRSRPQVISVNIFQLLDPLDDEDEDEYGGLFHLGQGFQTPLANGRLFAIGTN